MTSLTLSLRHTILRPKRARLSSRDSLGHFEGLARRDAATTTAVLEWDDVAEVAIGAERARECLWDFMRLVDDENPKAVPRFVREWGLLDSQGADQAWPGEGGSQAIAEWKASAAEVRRLLVAMVATEEGTALRAEALVRLGGVDGYLRHFADVETDGRSLLEVLDDIDELRLASYREPQTPQRRAHVQRQLVIGLLQDIAVPPEERRQVEGPVAALDFWYDWDEDGRRFDARVVGVRQIVASHLVSMFTAPKLDAFICDMCGSLFSPKDVGLQRRPRTGYSKLCSDQCRLDAKRDSNRASWRKHGPKWRPPSKKKGIRSGQARQR